MGSSPPPRGEDLHSRPLGRNVVIRPQEVIRIVLALQPRKLLVLLRPISMSDSIIALIRGHVIGVHSGRNIRLRGSPHFSRPSYVFGVVRGFRPMRDDGHFEVRLSVIK